MEETERRTAERSFWERRSACLANSAQSDLEDSATWADLMRRSARRMGSESSSWTDFSSTSAISGGFFMRERDLVVDSGSDRVCREVYKNGRTEDQYVSFLYFNFQLTSKLG